jgi:hypothetical protein
MAVAVDIGTCVAVGLGEPVGTAAGLSVGRRLGSADNAGMVLDGKGDGDAAGAHARSPATVAATTMIAAKRCLTEPCRRLAC